MEDHSIRVPTVGADHNFEVTGLADPLEIVVVVRQVLLSEREIDLGRCAGFQVQFPEAFELLDRTGGRGVNVVDIKLDDFVAGAGSRTEAVTEPSMGISEALSVTGE